jgi:hypothetical protein
LVCYSDTEIVEYYYHDPHHLQGGSIGDCVTDTFSFSSPGSNGSPIICGYNTGQHSKIEAQFITLYVCLTHTSFAVIVDASDSCNVASFDLSGTGVTREWDIKGIIS